MTSTLSNPSTAGTAFPGPMVRPSEVPCQVAGAQTDFTPEERADDAIWKVDALLAGRLMELAMKAGNRDKAHGHRIAMESAVNKRRALRIAVAERVGGCHFDAAGQAHQEVGTTTNA